MSKFWDIKLDARNLSSNEIVSQILANRGITDVEGFLHPSPSCLVPDEKMYNIDRAKDIILDTIKSDGKFFIYGDVDTDGCTATAIAYRYLKHFTDKIIVYTNVGKSHGVEDDFDIDAKLKDVNTVIVLDSINKYPNMYLNILNKGIKLIILDHHIPSKDVLAVRDEICLVSSAVDYDNPALSGSGVTWKVMHYVDKFVGKDYTTELADLAATGIIGDICNVGLDSMENRYICDLGFSHMTNPAIKAIIDKYTFDSTAVAFSISPLVNCANRLENNSEAVELFITDDTLRIVDIIDDLKSYKDFQKETVEKIYNEVVLKQAEAQKDNKCLYFMLEDSKNLSGLIANKVANEYCKPALVLSTSEDGTEYSGSMRSVGVDDFRAIINSTGLAVCEGHEMAAGITIKKNNFFNFFDAIEDALKDYDFVQKVDVDIQVSVPQISSYITAKLKEINRITGNGFKQVLVAVLDADNFTIKRMSEGKHMSVKFDNVAMVKWNIDNWDNVDEHKKISAIGTLNENKFMGNVKSQLVMTDYKFE